jgi:hypothetical protein
MTFYQVSRAKKIGQELDRLFSKRRVSRTFPPKQVVRTLLQHVIASPVYSILLQVAAPARQEQYPLVRLVKGQPHLELAVGFRLEAAQRLLCLEYFLCLGRHPPSHRPECWVQQPRGS